MSYTNYGVSGGGAFIIDPLFRVGAGGDLTGTVLKNLQPDMTMFSQSKLPSSPGNAFLPPQPKTDDESSESPSFHVHKNHSENKTD